MKLSKIEELLDNIPMCPDCEEMHEIIKDGLYLKGGELNQRYKCKKCGRRFVGK